MQHPTLTAAADDKYGECYNIHPGISQMASLQPQTPIQHLHMTSAQAYGSLICLRGGKIRVSLATFATQKSSAHGQKLDFMLFESENM